MIFRFHHSAARLTVMVACCSGAFACSGASDRAARPNSPAVVALPGVPEPPAPPLDTTQDLFQRVQDARMEMAPIYSVIALAAAGGDARTLSGVYAPDAELQMADSTFKGATAAIEALTGFARRTSMARMTRTSVTTTFLKDSVVADSGTYVMVSKRAGADSVVQRGRYVTTWRMHVHGAPWQIKADRLHPDRRGQSPAGR